MLGVLVWCAVVAATTLKVNVDSKGDFNITYNGVVWFTGGEYAVAGHSKSAHTLVQQGAPTTTTGHDNLGSYDATTLVWSTTSKGPPLLHTSFRTYHDDASVVVFEQFFPQDIHVPGGISGSASTVFPGFLRSPGPSDNLDCISYHGVFPQMHSCKGSTYETSHMGGVPLVMYKPTKEGDIPMVVFSPLNHPMASHTTAEHTYFGAGVKTSVQVIPKGWSQLFILSAGSGIGPGMMHWGDYMLKYSGRSRTDMYRDTTHSTIGFWTDNGGYYHYSIGDNKSLGHNYEEVLPKVKAYHDSLDIPFGHWQFDSWFYPKDGAVGPGGGGGAVTNWTALPSVFPHGMAYIQSKLKLPMVMHNRQWSTKSDYIKHLKYQWYLSKKAAVPEDPIGFFDWFFQQQEGWGLTMYEQDWMCSEYDEVEALQTNISMGDLWLLGMATGAARSNRTVQYCMPYALEVLSGSALPAVTNARATGDYFHALHQWAIGGTSLFYWALGILPFKDGFYSSTHRQIGGQTVGPEKNPDREALMATLSCAMVGPMDGIYLLNASRVMTTCRADGIILKPDRPIRTVEACFRGSSGVDPGSCFDYNTYSDVKGLGRVHYYFSDGAAALTPDKVDLPTSSSQQYAVFNWYNHHVTPLVASTDVTAGYEGHTYAVVSPVVSGWAFFGEINKYVTAAHIRFGTVTPSKTGITITVVGVPKDVVTVCAAREATWELVCDRVTFTSAGTKTITLH